MREKKNMTRLQALQLTDDVRNDFNLVDAEAKIFQVAHITHKFGQHFDFVVANVKLSEVRK
jgi:hypothetical protein